MNWLELSLTLLAYDLHMKKCIILKVFCTGERKKGVKTQRGLCTAVLLLFRIFSECFFLCSSHWGDFCVYLNWIYILFFFSAYFFIANRNTIKIQIICIAFYLSCVGIAFFIRKCACVFMFVRVFLSRLWFERLISHEYLKGKSDKMSLFRMKGNCVTMDWR